jgi:uncharacterized membrane protein
MRIALFRIGWTYLKGVLVIAAIVFLVETIAGGAVEVSRWLGTAFGDGETTTWQILIVVASALVMPWFVGLLTRFLVPHFQQDRGVQALMRWERHLSRELAPDDSRGYRVALLSWPNADVQTLVVVGATFHAPDSRRELAPVFIPNTPNFSTGKLHVAPVDKLSITEWRLRDLANFHLSLGSAVPPTQFDEDTPGS